MTAQLTTALLLALAISGCGQEQQKQAATRTRPEQPRPAVIVGQYAVQISRDEPNNGNEFKFSTGPDDFYVNRNGIVTVRRNGLVRGRFNLPMEHLPDMFNLQYLVKGDVLLLVYELTDMEGGTSIMARVHLREPTDVWSKPVPGWNIGPVVLESGLLCIGGGNFVGCFDIETWNWRWLHSDLYERFHFEAFQTPEVHADHVIFAESDRVTTPVAFGRLWRTRTRAESH